MPSASPPTSPAIRRCRSRVCSGRQRHRAEPGSHGVTSAAAGTRALRQRQATGLSSAEAARRLATAGPNAIAEAKGPSQLRRLLPNFVQLFALLLWAGALLALVAGTPQLAAAIVAVIVVNAVFSFVQEHRAEQAVAALRRMLPLRVRVWRDGEAIEVENEAVVPGDAAARAR